MQRREFFSRLGTAGAGFALVSPLLTLCSLIDKPNIIFIMADDLGYGDLGCYGQKMIKTPNIDRMAKEGIRFTQCYAGSTVCAPSRSVLMTGQHTGHTTVRGNFGKHGVKGLGGGSGRVPLRQEDLTIAKVMKGAGYVTGMTGKWGLGEPETSGQPNEQGFDEWFGYLNQRRAHNYYPEYLWHNKEKIELPGNTGGRETTYAHDLFTEFALDFIKRHSSEPFFLYVPFTIPHAEYEIPELESYVDKSWSHDEKVHASMVTRMDRDVGQIFDLLKTFEIDHRTLVFFCSDNGAARRWEGRFDSSGPLRGQKRDLYEGGIRTPMIVRWPEKVPAGRTCDAVWYFADILPTFSDLTSMPHPEHVDGVSVLHILMGGEQKRNDRFFYWEFFEQGFQQAVRWKNWKAVRDGLNGELELYDLSDDLSEEYDVSDQYPDVVQIISDYLETARTESENWSAI